MKTLQSINTILLTLVLLVVGTLGFAPEAYSCQCEFALYTDEWPDDTYPAKVPGNTWNTRTINTTVIEQGNSISRSGNEITLQPGTYHIHVVAEHLCGGRSRLRLRTTDDTTTLAVGHTYATDESENQLLTYLVVSSATTFRIEQFFTCPDSRLGGRVLGDGEPELNLTIRIVKVIADGCH